MHRHGYKGRKFGRKRDQRRALMKDLAGALIDNGSIKTTVPKAKEIVPYVEKLITKAKRGDLHARRQIITKVSHSSSAHRLVDDIAPLLKARNSGHLRINKDEPNRRGDNAPMAVVEFVDELTQAPVAVEAPKANKKEAPASAKVNAKAKKDVQNAPTKKKAPSAKAPKTATTKAAPKRSGIRGNK